MLFAACILQNPAEPEPIVFVSLARATHIVKPLSELVENRSRLPGIESGRAAPGDHVRLIHVDSFPFLSKIEFLSMLTSFSLRLLRLVSQEIE